MNPLERAFPQLAIAGYRLTSHRDDVYNCIAWAAGDTTRWWWPDRLEVNYWPAGISRIETLEAFAAAFATLGFSKGTSETLEPGIDKVAIFATPDEKPTHASRQLENGRWTSKLGRAEDIEHDLQALTSEVYGSVVLILIRFTETQSSAND